MRTNEFGFRISRGHERACRRRSLRQSERSVFDDVDEYHDPKVENFTNALLGIHRGLSQTVPPTNYQGVAIYCDWETSDAEWHYFHQHFLKSAY